MHVLYFHQHFSTPEGATGTRSYEMARKLIERGHLVTMVCGSYGIGRSGLEQPFINGIRQGCVDGIKVLELELPYANTDGFVRRTVTFLKFALRSAGIALTSKYDLLFATTTPLTAGIPGIFAKLLRRKRFVFEVRDLWPELPRAMGVITNPLLLFMLSVLEWSSYHAADACIGLAPGIVEGIEKRGVAADKITLIPNGCDLELFAEKAAEQGWRPQGINDGDLMAVFTGAHGMANGLDAVLDAAEVCKKRGRYDIKFVFIGEGKLKKSLKERAENNGLNNCFFLDAVPKTKLSGLLSRADMGLMILANVPAFYYGTSPNKFFDYIASGIPVLNNYPGWLAGLICTNKCGFAIQPDKPEEFAEALIRAADDRELLKQMGDEARKLAIREFDRKVLSEKFVDFLEKVAGAHEKIS